MLPIGGQTTGPIELKFFVETQEWPGGCYTQKFQNFKKKNVNI